MIRNDLILIGVLMIFAVMPLTLMSDADKKIAIVKVDGRIVREFDLTAEETFTLETRDGKNFIAIRNGAVAVVAADCPDKICVRRGAIDTVGETIACVPHRMLLEIARD